MDRKQEFLSYASSVRARTMHVVGSIPHDLFDWRPAPGRFSPADILRHLAAFERWAVVENVHGRPSRYPGHGPDLAESPDEVLGYFIAMHAESLQLISALDPAAFDATVETPAGIRMRAWKWLRAMLEHEIHHRGQLYLLMGLSGISTPPVFGMTSEQVRAASL